MFGCNVETFRVAMDGSNLERELARASLMAGLIALIIFVLLALVLGPWLWNNVLTKLVTVVKPAESVWQLLGLAVLLNLMSGN